MHPIRRRKKRPNYGVRTVEVCRGKNGFGFTISGQQPCILSCIVSDSPAEKAGLHPGDYLVAVNGQSVSKVPHDDVVRLIGCSSGILKLQIAENYYSDSSDEDVIAPARPRPKYLHKPRSGWQQQRSGVVPQQSRAAKVVRDLRTGAMFEEQLLETMSVPSGVITRPVNKVTLPLLQRWEPPVPVPLPPPRLYAPIQIDKSHDVGQDKVEYRALVGYLGTIEMPKELQPGSRLQVVRGCIKRLRAEKRAHTLVLMSVHTRSLTLTNCHQVILAEYPADRVTFCGSSSDDERRYFGLVTAAVQCVDDENDSGETISSSSCHVFAVELRLHGSHSEHAAKAEAFKLQCSVDADTGYCREFPDTSDPIITAVRVLYSARDVICNGENEEPLIANSPQPSNASSTTTTTTSSNSDSGIGFRDECGNHSDRILMVDVQNQRLHIQQVINNDHDGQLLQNNLASPKSCVYDLSHNSGNRLNRLSNEDCSARLTVRAMPDPVISVNSTLAVSSRSRSPLSSNSSEDDPQQRNSAAHSYVEQTVNMPVYDFPSFQTTSLGITTRSNDDMSVSSGTNKSQDQLNLSYKPKSYDDFTLDKIPLHCFPSEFQNKSVDVSSCNFSGYNKTVRSTDAMSVGSSQSQDPLLSYKLSPKVFGLSRPVTHSLEDLKAAEVPCCKVNEINLSLTSVRGQQWGSLQELRSFVANCFESSPVPDHMHLDQEASLETEEAERGVASWVTLRKLLKDPAGLHTFAEFLKKEISHENLYFWVACEKYCELTDKTERKKAAREIFDRYLCLGASEPVNVNSHARQVTQEKLGEATPELFIEAQKEIFNVMKFHCHPRFIKSELYKDCLLREISGEELPFPGGDDLDVGLQLNHRDESSPKGHSKLKKSRSDAEDCRRKSLLPWHRKNRSKSKDRGESECNKPRMLHQKQDAEDTVSVRSDVTSSRSSLVSWDLALQGSFSRQSVTSGELPDRENCALCRVILPDGATTVVQTRRNECIKDLVRRLLEKRGLHYSTFEVFMGNTDRPQLISLDEDSTTLGAKEVHVEQRVVFKLDLPDRKSVGVIAKPSKTLGEVLRPFLHKYGYKLDAVALCLMSENEVLELSLPVTTVDSQRLQVLTRNEGWKGDSQKKSGPTLDEITNRVFEELLQGKADGDRITSDQGSVRSEDWGSEYSSGILSRLLRRDSAFLEKARDSRVKGKKIGNSSKTDDSEPKPSTNKQPLIAKWKVSAAKLQGRSESDELYEGLKRAQRSRLEDQRGTEINSELPDFLKDKENAPQAGKKIRKLRRPDEPNSKFYETSDTTQGLASSHESLLMGSSSKFGCKGEKDPTSNLVSRYFESSFGTDSVVPAQRQSDEYFLGRPSSSFVNYNKGQDGGKTIPARPTAEKPSSSSKNNENACSHSTLDNVLVDSGILESKLQDEASDALALSRSRHLSDPPPLPPKPKHLPAKAPLWGSSSATFRTPGEVVPNNANNSRFVRPNEVKRDTKVCRNRRSIYLDQPSSSFV